MNYIYETTALDLYKHTIYLQGMTITTCRLRAEWIERWRCNISFGLQRQRNISLFSKVEGRACKVQTRQKIHTLYMHQAYITKSLPNEHSWSWWLVWNVIPYCPRQAPTPQFWHFGGFLFNHPPWRYAELMYIAVVVLMRFRHHDIQHQSFSHTVQSHLCILNLWHEIHILQAKNAAEAWLRDYASVCFLGWYSVFHRAGLDKAWAKRWFSIT